jgi:hypothetical protein
MVLAAASSYERGKGRDQNGKKRYAFVSTQFEVYTCKAATMTEARAEAKLFFVTSHSGDVRIAIECDGNTLHFEDGDNGKTAEAKPMTLVEAWEKHCPEEEKTRPVSIGTPKKEKRADGLLPIKNKYATSCKFCGRHIPVGEQVLWKPKVGVYHAKCMGDGKWTSG